jgi:o-succinylbenzoate---CoA ligase
MLVEAWLPRAAQHAPGRVAVETPGGNCSYTELESLARAGAAYLADRGAGPGTRVAIALPAGLAFAQALHACLLLGAVAVPVDLRLGAAERKRVLEGALIVIDEPLGNERCAPQPPAPAVHDLRSPALMIHTSGTTAKPRPVVLSYGNVLWSALGSAVALGVDPGERWLSVMPLAHIGGLSILLRSAIYATTAVVHERFETDRALHALRSEGITLVSVVATTLARLLGAGLARPPRLRCALAGGGPLPAGLLSRARDAAVPVSQTYGLSESCSQATTVPVAAIGNSEALGAGPPLFCTRVGIAADEEILLAGPTLARQSLDRQGWLHTGDLGRLDGRGRLHVMGRKADTIISGGENVAPSEVEAVLEAHPDVLEAAIIARPDAQFGEAVTAVVVPRSGAAVDAEILRRHCAGALAAYKVPRRVVVRAQPLPRTPSGKLLRRELG